MLSIRRRACRFTVLLPTALAASMAAAAPADAAHVSESSGSIQFAADGGESNSVAISLDSSSNRVKATISDLHDIKASGNCSYPDQGNRLVVVCTARDDTTRVDVDLGDGDDSLRVLQSSSQGPPVRIQDGSGNDLVTVNTGTTTWVNGSGDDIYHGGTGRDTALEGDGNDIINGGYGDDSLNGGAGNDKVAGSVGDDFVDGSSGYDVVEGNAGDDHVRGGPDGDFVFGGGGDDRLEGVTGFDRLFGGPGADTLDGSRSTDVKFG